MKTYSRLVVVLLLTQFVALPDLRAQALESFSIIPPDPTTADLVRITVHGTIAWANVHLVDSSIVSMEGGFDISLIAVTDSEVSIPILLPYSRTFYVRIFAPGRYSVLANFYLNGRIWNTADTAFVVSEPSAVEQDRLDNGNVSGMSLHQNHPNPFNPSTTIAFDLPRASAVTLKIFDLVGREVATLAEQKMQAGRYSFKWDASGLPGGMYFYRLQTEAFTQTRKLLLLR